MHIHACRKRRPKFTELHLQLKRPEQLQDVATLRDPAH